MIVSGFLTFGNYVGISLPNTEREEKQKARKAFQ